MAAMREFTTHRSERRIEFSLDGRVMTFTPPSFAPFLFDMPDETASAEGGKAALRVMLDWLGAGLSDEDGDWIVARLRDAADPLDIDTVSEIIEGLMEDVTDRPTKRSSGSSRSLDRRTATDGSRPGGSIPPIRV
jgi:hypothetical protein